MITGGVEHGKINSAKGDLTSNEQKRDQNTSNGQSEVPRLAAPVSASSAAWLPPAVGLAVALAGLVRSGLCIMKSSSAQNRNPGLAGVGLHSMREPLSAAAAATTAGCPRSGLKLRSKNGLERGQGASQRVVSTRVFVT